MTERVTIGTATIAVTYDGVDRHVDGFGSEERRRYTTVITSPDWEYVDNDVHSAVGADVDERNILRSVLSFLGAEAEAYGRNMAPRDDALYPPHVAEWAYMHSDEIAMAHEGIDLALEGKLR